MKVEVWSDYQCPFCYIGKRRFEKALSQFAQQSEVEVEFKSFELDPHAQKDMGMNVHEMLAKKYGTSVEQAKEMSANVTSQAKGEGLDYRFDTLIPTNTFDAHRLLKFASVKGKEKEMNETLFHAYFTESKHIGDQETLASLAKQVGLDKTEVTAMLASDQFTEEVRADEREGSQLGITGVPFFVINRKYGVSGAQPTELFLETLNKVWTEENPLQILNEASTENSCSDGSCAVPEK
ncbi:DsbA family oxidoreductase [Peribacillus huizhouensis]|uniref:DsbA family dithiol-disulfide isomerase n=1 Tax=Peribacillus huizhouensis TaxID=1501239 RepID=A0ABR6CMU4_9BACI|nr:DsbA family oxidoreductase [Peribacillus huizhouensis]MBA9026229.1 putative DsbA family dithiol-disulfide isomerase [Peribacillus huizhouensis]